MSYVGNREVNQLSFNEHGHNWGHFYGNSSNRLYFGASDTLTTVPPSPMMMWDLATGNVSIGTASPAPVDKFAVWPTDATTNTAIEGYSPNGSGIVGISDTYLGVYGYCTGPNGAAVSGWNPEGTGIAARGKTLGVFGTGDTGVQGTSVTGNGVVGRTSSNTAAGVTGISDGTNYGAGVFGHSIDGSGVDGASENGVGVSGSSVSNWCGQFMGINNTTKGVYISVPAGQPGLQVASGTKNAIVATSQGTRTLYTEEATAVWFTDYGFGHLQAGHAIASIDPLFAETVNLSEPYHVFVQINDAEAEGTAVINKTVSSFEVVELRQGRSNAEFSYRLVAKRHGYEINRLDEASSSDDDPNLYPEKRSAWESQHVHLLSEVEVAVPSEIQSKPRDLGDRGI